MQSTWREIGNKGCEQVNWGKARNDWSEAKVCEGGRAREAGSVIVLVSETRALYMAKPPRSRNGCTCGELNLSPHARLGSKHPHRPSTAAQQPPRLVLRLLPLLHSTPLHRHQRTLMHTLGCHTHPRILH